MISHDPLHLQERITTAEAERRWGPPRHSLAWEFDTSAERFGTLHIGPASSAPLPEVPFRLGALTGRLRLSVAPSMYFDSHRVTCQFKTSVLRMPGRR